MPPIPAEEPSLAFATLAGATVATSALVEVYRRLAWRLRIVDQPGGRRLHVRATPRGGGIVIWLVWLVASLLGLGLPDDGAAAGLTVAATGMTWLGFWDDVRPLSAYLRLVAQVVLLAAAAAIWLAPAGLAIAPVWGAVAFVAALFTINAFNFVDGADGLVPLQTLALLGGLHLCLGLDGADLQRGFAISDGRLALAAACVLGFLPWNWPRAWLFLGDAGSLLLGTLCVGAALQAIVDGSLRPEAAAALFAVVCVDPAWTLLRRLLRRAPVLQAHLEHGYHRLLLRDVSHLRLSAGATAYTALWSTPIAIALQLRWLHPLLGLALVVVPLLALAVMSGAGRPEPVEPSAPRPA